VVTVARRAFVVAVVLVTAVPSAGGTGNPSIQFSSAWRQYVVAGTRPARGLPADVTRGSPATLIWRHEVAGYLKLTFGSVAPGTAVRIAFSETAEYLGVEGTSDWSRTYLTDDVDPASGETWVDRPGCAAPGICADGYRAFRFARVYVERGSARILKAVVVPVAADPPPQGWFLSSDDQLNRIWYASAYTAQLMQLPADPALLGSGCAVPSGRTLVVDGAKRDRCPWAGDLAVSGPSLLLTEGAVGATPLENTLTLLAGTQRPDGGISPSPMTTGVLFDYPAYWVLAVDDLMLYRGVGPVAGYWSAVTTVLDRWYPGFAGDNGLLQDAGPPGDYAYIGRAGPLVAYYNALYARALEAGAQLADALGHADSASRWRERAASLQAPFAAAFWDPSAGAFQDSPSGPVVHPQDGNAFAILAGLATPAQAASALAYLDRTTKLRWGDALADTNAWSSAPCNNLAAQCVFPFISYFDLEARYAVGADASALDELRRTWGWMLSAAAGTTGTDWEAIGAGGSIDGYERAASSLAAGWSTGALPVLTNEVLGIRPTGPAFSTFDAIPHASRLAWAQGSVPTPAGAITFGFKRISGGYLLRLEAPSGLVARVGAPVSNPRVLVDGTPVTPASDGTVVLHGSHRIEVLRP
jgi:hypothetical protein